MPSLNLNKLHKKNRWLNIPDIFYIHENLLGVFQGIVQSYKVSNCFPGIVQSSMDFSYNITLGPPQKCVVDGVVSYSRGALNVYHKDRKDLLWLMVF